MFTDQLKSHLEAHLSESISAVKSVSGGDISPAYLLQTNNKLYFLKCNSNAQALSMFEAEKTGLETIASTATIKTPNVYGCDQIDHLAFILMDYVKPKSANHSDMAVFATHLSQLHQCQADEFGFDGDNFIGSLPQSNVKHNTWTAFYVHERLLPQLKLAMSSGLLNEKDTPEHSRLHQTCDQLFKDVKPSLLHGDLWGGNYLISEAGDPYLIDPAVYYGHCEVDIAMSKLFGGFSERFYQSYHDRIPKTDGFDERVDIYQLYYLLVHLNLFGVSYYGSVKRILNRYF